MRLPFEHGLGLAGERCLLRDTMLLVTRWLRVTPAVDRAHRTPLLLDLIWLQALRGDLLQVLLRAAHIRLLFSGEAGIIGERVVHCLANLLLIVHFMVVFSGHTAHLGEN